MRDVRDGDTLVVAHRMPGADTIQDVLGLLSRTSTFLRQYNLDSAELVGWNVVMGDHPFAQLSYELHSATSWARISLYIMGSGAPDSVAGFHWQPARQSLRQENALAFTTKPIGYSLFFAAGVLMAALSLAGLVAAIRAHLRWWWAIVAILGLFKISLYWTTGDLAIAPLSVQLFSFSAFRAGLVGPWTVSISLPIGALLTWWKLIAKRRAASPTQPPIAA
jgi:hypothetical protein